MLAPAHTLGAYLFLAFLIGHLYLATTGETPLSLLRAITIGHKNSLPDAAARDV